MRAKGESSCAQAGRASAQARVHDAYTHARETEPRAKGAKRGDVSLSCERTKSARASKRARARARSEAKAKGEGEGARVAR